MDMFAGAACTAVRELFERAPDQAAPGQVVRVSSGSVGVLVEAQRLVVLDARPGPDSLPCSVLTPTLATASPGCPVRLGDGVELSSTGLRAARWSVQLVRWWEPAQVKASTPGPRRAPTWQSPAVLEPAVTATLRRAARALGAGDVAAAVAHTLRVLGRGPGSTPAADDAVAGLLLAARAWSRPRGVQTVEATGQRISAHAPARTTALSAELLRHAGRGIATRTVVRAVLHSGPENRARGVGLGATSGAALLGGLDHADAEYASTRAAA
jgi:hypothetical protein